MIAQESVTNAIKHAAAAKIVMALTSDEERLVMRITDDGQGFDVDGKTGGSPGHFGCMGMRERCRKIGAEIAWKSEKGKGTEVTVSLPLPNPLDAEGRKA